MTIIFVVGGAGPAGSNTTRSLLLEEIVEYGKASVIRIATRDLGTVKEKKQVNMSKSKIPIEYYDGLDLRGARGADVMILIPPNHLRIPICTAAIKAAKDNNIKFLIVVSSHVADQLQQLIGKQLHEIEVDVARSGVPFCIVRTAAFLENHWIDNYTISSLNAICYPGRSDAKANYISLSDVGKFVAVLADQQLKHSNIRYTITGPSVATGIEFAHFYTKLLGKQIEYIQVSNEKAITTMVQFGIPLEAAKGIVELFHNSDIGLSNYITRDFELVTGFKPHSWEQFVESKLIPSLRSGQ